MLIFLSISKSKHRGLGFCFVLFWATAEIEGRGYLLDKEGHYEHGLTITRPDMETLECDGFGEELAVSLRDVGGLRKQASLTSKGLLESPAFQNTQV